MGKEYVIYEKDGEQVAHTATYEAKDGEIEVGRVESDTAEKALRKFKRSGSNGDEAADEENGESYSMTAPRAKQSEEALAKQTEKENDKLRKEEEEKEEFEVMQDAQGNVFVQGGESDPSKKKAKASKSEAPEPPEPGSLGTFRAKDEKEAIARATGKYVDPAQGAQRGAQTP